MKKIIIPLLSLVLFSIQNAHAINLGKIKLPVVNTPTNAPTSGGSPPVGSTPVGPSTSNSNEPANVRLGKQIESYVESKFGFVNDSNGKHVNVESAQQLISGLEAKYGPSKMVEGTACWLLIADKAADTCINVEVPEAGVDYATKKAIVRLKVGGALCSSNRNLDYGVQPREVH